MIIVYNRTREDHSKDLNNYPIFRPNILSNPYTHIKDKQTLAKFICRDRDEAIDKYSHYYDIMYGHNKEFTRAIDEIYEKYKRGETVYLECYCAPLRCHGDIIVDKLQKRLLKEKIANARNKEKEVG